VFSFQLLSHCVGSFIGRELMAICFNTDYMAQPSAATNFVSRKKAQKAQKEAIARMESWSVE
jgi:hypothetical protein